MATVLSSICKYRSSEIFRFFLFSFLPLFFSVYGIVWDVMRAACVDNRWEVSAAQPAVRQGRTVGTLPSKPAG